jgi:hypothetical protein
MKNVLVFLLLAGEVNENNTLSPESVSQVFRVFDYKKGREFDRILFMLEKEMATSNVSVQQMMFQMLVSGGVEPHSILMLPYEETTRHRAFLVSQWIRRLYSQEDNIILVLMRNKTYRIDKFRDCLREYVSANTAIIVPHLGLLYDLGTFIRSFFKYFLWIVKK